MLKLRNIFGAVLGVFAPLSATAAPDPKIGTQEASPAPEVSHAARVAVNATTQKLKVQKGVGKNRYFAQDKGPSWVNSPRHIKDGHKVKVLPGQVR